MKWVVDKIGIKQVWYSGDVIEKIKSYIEDYKNNCKQEGVCIDDRMCSTCFYGGAIELGEEILDIIESEDK